MHPANKRLQDKVVLEKPSLDYVYNLAMQFDPLIAMALSGSWKAVEADLHERGVSDLDAMLCDLTEDDYWDDEEDYGEDEDRLHEDRFELFMALGWLPDSAEVRIATILTDIPLWRPLALKMVQEEIDRQNLIDQAIEEMKKKPGYTEKNPSDIRDALYHVENQEDLPRGALKPSMFHQKCVPRFNFYGTDEDFGSWPQFDEGELLELSDVELQEELVAFRGEDFADLAWRWMTSGKWPPIVVVEHDDVWWIGDGRGRVSVAIGLGMEHLPAIVLSSKLP